MLEDLIIYTPMYVTFFWAVVLLVSKRAKNQARFFLGIFMFIAFLLYLSHAHYFNKTISGFQFFEPLYVFASLSVYPLYFWYIKLLTVETVIKPKNLLMLLPALIFGLASMLLYQLMDEADILIYIKEFVFEKKPTLTLTPKMMAQKIVFDTSRLVFLVQVLYLLYYGRKLIITYQDKISNFYSNLEDRSILWANYLLYAIVATSVLSIIFNILGREVFLDMPILLLIPSLLFSVLLFLIGYLGNLQNYTVIDLKLDEQTEQVPEPQNGNNEKLKKRLIALFENEKSHLNINLKITHVADMLNSNRTYVSKLINTEFSCTFSEFVNRYRVEEAKRLLCDESSKDFSLDYVAEKSGFGSMVNFMRVFREIEGITPGRFRENMEQK